jgi:hypothetical protein
MKEEEKEEPQNEPSVENIFDTYHRNIYGSELYFSKFSNLAVSEDKEEIKRSKEYMDLCFQELGLDPEDKTKSKKEFSTEAVQKFARKMTKISRITQKNFEILANSSFLMLNNYFEYLLADLLSYYYNKFDGSISGNEMVTTLGHLNEFETIDDFKKDLIQREVESMLIEMTFPHLLKHFDEFLQIELCKDIIDWSKIEEFRERRHLIVHNSARVNKKYITRTKNPFDFKQGDLIHINSDYFNSALKEFKLAGYLLIFSCWGKWDKDESTGAISQLMIESFEALKNNDPDFSLRLTMYLKHVEPRDEQQEDIILRTKFNKCIALQLLEKNTELKKELKKIKVGTASPLFKLGHAILSGSDLSHIIELIKQSYALDDFDIDKYLEWPIYKTIRENSETDKLVIKTLKELEPTKAIANAAEKVPAKKVRRVKKEN